jgi:hypothetical protein
MRESKNVKILEDRPKTYKIIQRWLEENLGDLNSVKINDWRTCYTDKNDIVIAEFYERVNTLHILPPIYDKLKNIFSLKDEDVVGLIEIFMENKFDDITINIVKRSWGTNIHGIGDHIGMV